MQVKSTEFVDTCPPPAVESQFFSVDKKKKTNFESWRLEENYLHYYVV